MCHWTQSIRVWLCVFGLFQSSGRSFCHGASLCSLPSPTAVKAAFVFPQLTNNTLWWLLPLSLGMRRPAGHFGSIFRAHRTCVMAVISIKEIIFLNVDYCHAVSGQKRCPPSHRHIITGIRRGTDQLGLFPGPFPQGFGAGRCIMRAAPFVLCIVCTCVEILLN